MSGESLDGDPDSLRLDSSSGACFGAWGGTTGELDMATRSLQVEIDLDNKDGKLTPGMYADVTHRQADVAVGDGDSAPG